MPQWLLTLLPSLLGPLIGVGGSALSSRRLTGAQNQQNEWNAQQAQQANEWNKENYQHRYQWEVQDMQAAGLNPALLYGGSSGAGSVPGTTPASGAFQGNPSDPASLVGSILDMALLGAQIDNIKADTRQKNANAGNIEALTPAQVGELESRIRKNNQDVSESEARESATIVQTVLASKDVEFYDKFKETELKLMESQTKLNDEHANLSKEQRAQIEQNIKNLKQEIVESFSRMAVNAANAGYLDQATLNAMEEQKLIEVRRAGERVQYMLNDKILSNYDTDKWFIRAQQGFGALRDLGIGVGSAVSILPSPARPRIGYKP